MIITLMNQKRGLNRFNKLPDDGDLWAPNNLLKPGANICLIFFPIFAQSIDCGGSNRVPTIYVLEEKKKNRTPVLIYKSGI